MSTQTLSPAERPSLEGIKDNQPKLTFADCKRPGFQCQQPDKTLSGSPIPPLQIGLPKTTQSLCPECTQLLEARIFEEDGKVWIDKTCAEHGYFRDVYYGDVKLYLKMEEWHFGDGVGLSNPSGARRHAVSQPVRPLLHARLPHRSGQYRSDQPLQPDLPGMLCQLPMSPARCTSPVRRGAAHAAGAAQRASGGRPRRAVLRRRADASIRVSWMLSLWPRRWVSPTSRRPPTASCWRTWNSRGKARDAGLSTLYLQFDGCRR